jgi:hypothetical protein
MKRLNCFSKRDFGGIILVGIGIAEIIVALLLLLSLKINQKALIYGVIICTSVFGIGYFSAYFANARTRFRPCWYLPMGLLLLSIGGVFAIFNIAGANIPSVSISTLVMCIAGFNFIVSMSNSFHLNALCLSRWYTIALFSIINACYSLFIYFDFFSLRSKTMLCVAVMFILLAFQTLIEPFYIFRKEKANENN